MAEFSDLAALPPPTLLVGTDTGLRSVLGPPTQLSEEDEAGLQGRGLATAPALPEPVVVNVLHVAENGAFLACSDGEDVWVQRMGVETPEEAFRAANPRTLALHFSPLCTYLLAWQRWDQADKSPDAKHGGNLKVFRVADGEVVGSYMLRSRRNDAWPAIQWSADEAFCVRAVTNEVRIESGLFDGEARPEPVSRIRLERVEGFALSPGESYPLRVATYVPAGKSGSPAPRVAIWHWAPSDSAEGAEPFAVGTKTLTRTEEVDLVWSPTGSGLLIRTSSAVDQSGDSYYGGTGLFMMTGDGSFQCIVTPPKPGKIEDAQWNPNGREFVLVAGSQPAKSTLFNLHGEGVFDFGENHRNCVRWAPHGRFLMIGGFGNLVGEMTFWDRNKLKPMNEIVAPTPSTSYGWSPDSRYFLTATTRPRMNVENSVHIFRYNGDGPLLSEHFECLTLAQWLPGSQLYPDRPQSPQRLKKKKTEAKETKAAPAATGKYVPPSQRGFGGGSFVAQQLRAEHESSGAKKLHGVRAEGSKGGRIPGMPVGAAKATEPMSKSAKTRARRKKKQEEKEAKEAAAKLTEAMSASSPASPSPEQVDPQKKLKKLRKKLQQILTLKERQQSGETLDADQVKKLEGEEAIQEEIASLEAQVRSE